MPEPRKRPARKPRTNPNLVPAHPDLVPGLERLGIPTVPGTATRHPMFYELLAEMVERTKPA